MKKILLTIYACLAAVAGMAQFTTAGKIEYERKTNTYAQMEGEDNEWFEKIKSQVPKFNITYFDLLFDTAHTIYKPGREVENKGPKMFGAAPAADNIVLSDLKAEKIKAVKNVFEQKFLVQDTMRHMDWRVKDEIRTIAGYKCRKAVGRICDSVYVVAFYTEDIPAASGPEMFGNLPGMILELAIPRLHTTWVATKVEFTSPVAGDFAVADKGKKVTEQELFETVKDSFKDWGKRSARYIWWIVL